MKMEKLFLVIASIALVMLVVNQNKTETPVVSPVTTGGSGGTVDLCKLVDGQVSFTGQRMYLVGTALTNEYARVIRIGSKMDLGYISENSGTVSVTPNANYKIYYGENSTTYYTVVEDYKAPCQDSPDNKVGVECLMDTGVTTATFDENGQVQSSTANPQTIGASDVVDVEVKVKTAADSCFGNPQSPKKNAICFQYNTTAFDSVKANTPSISAPYSVSQAVTAGNALSCYELNLLKDTESQMVTVTLDATTAGADTYHNITVYVKDVDMDLNQDTLEEIWDYQDETNTRIGQAAATDIIYIS